MKLVSFVVCCAVFAQIIAVNAANALTNAEFYDLIKDYITDVDVLGKESDVIGDDNDHVINLPGGPDDEIDLEYIADKLGLLRNGKGSRQVGFFHHHHHHHHHSPSFSCHCRHDSCSCCLKHTFKANLIFKKIRFRLNACLTVTYLRSNIGFEITFVINGHRLYHKEISLKHPPSLCFGVPGLKRFARVCLEFYNVNLRTKRLCARLTGVLDLKVKKFKVHLKLGCFRIPILDEQALTNLLNDRDFLWASVQESKDESTEVELQDLVAIYRQLQDDQVDANREYID